MTTLYFSVIISVGEAASGGSPGRKEVPSGGSPTTTPPRLDAAYPCPAAGDQGPGKVHNLLGPDGHVLAVKRTASPASASVG